MEKVSSEKLKEVGLMLSISNNLIQQAETILYNSKLKEQSKELREIENNLFLLRTGIDSKLENILIYKELKEMNYKELNNIIFPLHSEIVGKIEKIL
ncbi:hypothetical protein ACV30O_12890 [Clostridium perfringens]